MNEQCSPDVVESLLTAPTEMLAWPLIGRGVRAGSWARQAETTLDRIDAALLADRAADAAGLVEHLGPETQEIYELLEEWSRQIPAFLLARGVTEEAIAAAVEAARIEADWSDLDPATARAAFLRRLTAVAAQIRAGARDPRAVEAAVQQWIDLHDRLLIVVGALVDLVARELGEARLGELWQTLQAEGIASYERYSTEQNPWRESFARLVQIAIEGMHGHFGGPRRRGEITLEEFDDRTSVSFDPCGSGGRLMREGRSGTTRERHPFAWNEIGVCNYCIHCCVLQQLEPIKRNGFPGRVIDPPREGREVCTWTVYRDPSLIPDEAFLRVGQQPPERSG